MIVGREPHTSEDMPLTDIEDLGACNWVRCRRTSIRETPEVYKISGGSVNT